MSGDGGSTVRLSRATALLDMNRFAQARPLLAQALAEDAGSSAAWCAMARCCHGLEDYPGALHAADQAIAAAPGEAVAWRLRALALLGSKRLTEASAAARESLRLEPEFWFGHVLTAMIALADPRSQIGEAAYQAATRGRQLGPENAVAHFIVGCVAERLKHPEEAEACYREALGRDPEHRGSRNNLSRLLMKQGDHFAAAQGFAAVAAADRGVGLGTFNLRVMAVRLLARARWISLVGLLVADMTVLGTAGDASWPTRGVLLALLVLCWALWAVWVLRQIPPLLLRPMLRTARGSGYVGLSLLGVSACTLAAVALLAVPPLGRWADLVVIVSATAQFSAFTAARRVARSERADLN
ncbi:tetratricopeptide (TPR) repeat protein [Streptacidiphilus sp. MAP12-16]|uniref:tetratricopeptide repeat protein n=1 Tax=Streptacidiphilus sp. MAP12-16 TaxID=3156300 RepID=UPI0035150D80